MIVHGNTHSLNLKDGSIQPNGLEFFENKKKIEKEKNYTLVILPTEKCNFCCNYCYEKLTGPKWSTHNNEYIIEFADKVLKKYPGITLEWFGGEPLLEIDSIVYLTREIQKKCIKLKKKFMCGITTNAYLLNQSNFKKLTKAGVSSYQITIDGNQAIHDTKRKLKNGGKTFDVIMKNLIDIKNVPYEFVNISIRINVCKETMDVLDELCMKLEREFGDERRYSFYFRPIGNWGGDRILEMKDDLLDTKNFYKTIAQKQYKLNFWPHYEFIFNNLCFASDPNSIVVGPDMRIMKCTMLLDEASNEFGYLYDIKDVPEIEIISQGNHYGKNCLECINKEICIGYSCPVSKKKNYNLGQCSYELGELKYIVDLISNEKTLQIINKKK